MESGLFLYLAHPDLFLAGYQEFDDTAKYLSRQLCREANRLKMPLEYNLYGLIKCKQYTTLGYPYPGFWEIAAEENVTAVVGVDAHGMEHVDGRDISTFALVQEYMLAGKFDVEGFITHRFKLEDYREAFRVMLANPPELVKIVLENQ